MGLLGLRFRGQRGAAQGAEAVATREPVRVKYGKPRIWQAIRRAVFARDGYRCVQCGRAGRLECDHVKPVKIGGALHDLANLQTLCRDCHFAKTGKENERVKGRAEWGRRLSLVQGGKP